MSNQDFYLKELEIYRSRVVHYQIRLDNLEDKVWFLSGAVYLFLFIYTETISKLSGVEVVVLLPFIASIFGAFRMVTIVNTIHGVNTYSAKIEMKLNPSEERFLSQRRSKPKQLSFEGRWYTWLFLINGNLMVATLIIRQL